MRLQPGRVEGTIVIDLCICGQNTHATFKGTAEVNGVSESFTVEVDDCSEPGTADTFSITLSGGNIQIHR